MTQTMYAHMNKWKKILVTDDFMQLSALYMTDYISQK
jgi:hypothetical protein